MNLNFSPQNIQKYFSRYVISLIRTTGRAKILMRESNLVTFLLIKYWGNRIKYDFHRIYPLLQGQSLLRGFVHSNFHFFAVIYQKIYLSSFFDNPMVNIINILIFFIVHELENQSKTSFGIKTLKFWNINWKRIK